MDSEKQSLTFHHIDKKYGSAGPGNTVYSEGNMQETTMSSKRIIYCVHGKPNGCCVVTEEEITDKTNGDTTNELVNVLRVEHCHRTRGEGLDTRARRKLILASIICVIFMLGEVVGGYLSSSLAIATDAAHLLTDFASFMISLISLWISARPPTRKMSFGWYRAEVIGALTSVLMIWVITAILVYMAIERVISKAFEINAVIMLITSAVGVLVNVVMGCTLHSHNHSHGSHTHTHIEDDERNLKDSDGDNINVRAAYIHVIGDFIQSIGVFIAALIIYFKPMWSIVDPICTFLFSVLVLLTTFAIIKDAIVVLMEGMPKGVDFTSVLNTFLQQDGVLKVHNLRIWALSLDKTALSAHLAIRPGVNPQKILHQVNQEIHSRFNFFEMTLQIEEFDVNMEHCSQCQGPES